ncbi:methyl-accepting chemotaxis protein [Larsenimonas salina]|uniref:methyl-accepting chemotaxis protein n=1 Tax=Larsenimonas salina TaxID=1295565 RepID=UPI002073AA53|nr:methyl-accepting chemotaxis protein [Larsenimonas salina]MCM5704890.1 methyl-accepting chemotaxis protein [Larsenimonas salina]
MPTRFHSLKFKYGAAFVSVALLMIIVTGLSEYMLESVKQRMNEFSGKFNTSISAVLNADRDLYQAHTAELNYLQSTPGTERAQGYKATFEENAQQAFDRMQVYKDTLSGYPELITPLADFEARFDQWKQVADEVLTLHAAGNSEQALALSRGAYQTQFDQLRALYDLAGESAGAKTDALGAETLERVGVFEAVILIVSLFAVTLAMAVAIVGPRRLTKNIQALIDRIEDITRGEGDLTQRLSTERKDELGKMAGAFNHFIEHIDWTLGGIRSSTDTVHSSSREIARSSSDMAARTEKTAANLQQTTASMEDITSAVNKTSQAAREASTLADSTAQLTRGGQKAIEQVEHTVTAINDSSVKASDIITLIDGIAFQTNLLALNASVEAARAGEHGRGFAVVAHEVRTLSGRVSDASHNIRELMETSVENARNGTELVKQASEAMASILSSVEEVNDIINRISVESQSQSEGVSQINHAINELDHITQQNAAMVEESSAAAADMSEQATKLHEVIGSFKLSSHANTGAPSAKAPAHTRPRAASPSVNSQKPAGTYAPKAPQAVNKRENTSLRAAPATKPANTTVMASDDDDWTEF